MAPLLELDDVHARYGPVRRSHGVSLSVREGEVVAVLGGERRRQDDDAPRRSRARVDLGRDPVRGRAHRARRAGARRARGYRARPRGPRHLHGARSTRTCGSAPTSHRDGLRPRATSGRVALPVILEPRRQQAGTLSGGEQQMLAIARALMARPRLLLLDEPSLGLAPIVVREIFGILGDLNEKEGLAVLVVEQNARLALRSSSRAYVLEVGRGRARGPERRARPRTSPSAAATSGTDVTEFLQQVVAGLASGSIYAPARARDRDHLPRDRGRELRAGRDGDVHDASSPGRSSNHGVGLLGRLCVTLSDRVRGGRRSRSSGSSCDRSRGSSVINGVIAHDRALHPASAASRTWIWKAEVRSFPPSRPFPTSAWDLGGVAVSTAGRGDPRRHARHSSALLTGSVPVHEARARAQGLRAEPGCKPARRDPGRRGCSGSAGGSRPRSARSPGLFTAAAASAARPEHDAAAPHLRVRARRSSAVSSARSAPSSAAS